MKKLTVAILSVMFMLVGMQQSAQAMSTKDKQVIVGVLGGLTVGYLGSQMVNNRNNEQEVVRYDRNRPNYRNVQTRNNCRYEEVYKRQSNGTLVPVQMQVCDNRY